MTNADTPPATGAEEPGAGARVRSVPRSMKRQKPCPSREAPRSLDVSQGPGGASRKLRTRLRNGNGGDERIHPNLCPVNPACRVQRWRRAQICVCVCACVRACEWTATDTCSERAASVSGQYSALYYCTVHATRVSRCRPSKKKGDKPRGPARAFCLQPDEEEGKGRYRRREREEGGGRERHTARHGASEQSLHLLECTHTRLQYDYTLVYCMYVRLTARRMQRKLSDGRARLTPAPAVAG